MGRPEYALARFKFTPLLKEGEAFTRRIGRKIISPYQLLLFISDLLTVNFAFLCGLMITGYAAFLWESTLRNTNAAILCLTVIAFFPAYHLYSYHHLFLRGQHFVNLCKSFFWGFLALGLVVGIYSYPEFLKGSRGIYVVIVGAFALLILSRFYRDYLIYVLSAVGVAFMAVGALGLINAGEKPLLLSQWPSLLVCGLLAVGFASVSRYFWVHVVFGRWMRRHFRKQVAIIGTDEESDRITNHVISRNAPFWIAGFVGRKEFVESERLAVAKRRLGDLKELSSIIDEEKIDEIVVTDESMDKAMLISLLDFCTSEGITVWFPPKLMPIIDMKLYIDTFCGLPMIRLCAQKHSWFFNKIKHGLDSLLAIPILLVLLPVFAVIAVAIKVTSPGPVFYRAKAIGKGGREFTLYKFRSMKVNNGCDIHKEYVTKLIKGEICAEGSENKVFKITDDPRITSVGRFLRKLSLDELPQILNVLKGDMSLVGPRPCLPYEYEIYKDWHKKRSSIRPGITGLWQVAGRSEVLFEDMILLDLYYLYNRSLLMDMSTIYETVFVVLKKKGAY